MERIWFFDFETRTWSSRITSGGREKWTFGHAIKRGRYMYAYGTHQLSSQEESSVAVQQLPPDAACEIMLRLELPQHANHEPTVHSD